MNNNDVVFIFLLCSDVMILECVNINVCYCRMSLVLTDV
jgi:hypothetical protein